MSEESFRLSDSLECTDSGIPALAGSESAHSRGELTKDAPPEDQGERSRRMVQVGSKHEASLLGRRSGEEP